MDPMLLSIATAAAGTLAGEAAKGVVAAGRFVKERFSGDAGQELVLLRAETGKVPAETLAAAIERACADDPEFRRELSELAGRPIQVTDQAGQQVKFQNNYYGAGPTNVVQAETINNLHLD
ncbi:hypothetical protein [Glycomyces harbinensis]|uniref:Uncharacterized protein n=1 Tax=Glycomyces harbinensis TaxID=58114 RepID=A0A1G7CCM4_9ACTN|nr:hypothetical protein [Glycomyces harbinensis]SDE36466.1 hypothetical protein SAMN05216270_11959 [Glycomyces harbinensis]